jgi:hypothetical protein
VQADDLRRVAVEQDDVRAGAPQERQEILLRAGVAHHHHVAFGLEHDPDASPQYWMAVHDQRADHRSCSSSGCLDALPWGDLAGMRVAPGDVKGPAAPSAGAVEPCNRTPGKRTAGSEMGSTPNGRRGAPGRR